MEEEIYVSCHAPSLSLLLYETARSFHDQKGLLIGQICNEVVYKKTDESETDCKLKTAIYLEHCIPIEDEDVISNAGAINKTKLLKVTDMLQNKIVGWYSFRRNTCLVPNSLNEILIHKSLLEIIPKMRSQYFVACFMSSSIAANRSTHSFNHIFMTYDKTKARFKSLKFKIYSLSDKNVNSNGYLIKNSFPTSTSFDRIINSIQEDNTSVKLILDIQNKVSDTLRQMDLKLQKAENARLQLQLEVDALKKKVGRKQKGTVLIEEEPEKPELKISTIRYDPNVRYTPNEQIKRKVD